MGFSGAQVLNTLGELGCGLFPNARRGAEHPSFEDNEPSASALVIVEVRQRKGCLVEEVDSS